MICYLGLSLTAILVLIAFRMGWNKGINDTLDYFHKHPISPEFLEKHDE